MTLEELWEARKLPEPPVFIGRIEGEMHGRLVRSASLLVLPLLAVPMGLAAKRARRWHGIALSTLILVLYHHSVQLAESLGDAGLIDPRPALWGAFLLFTGFSLAVFLRANRFPAEGPFDRPLAALQEAADAVASLKLFRRRHRAQ
jgi:lipopolysaccharide export system permease protein